MRLIRQTRETRVWQLDDGTYWEQRAQLYGQHAEMMKQDVEEFPELGHRTGRMISDALLARLARDGVQVIDGSATMTARIEKRWHYLWDDEKDDVLRDEEGHPVIDDTRPPYEVIVYTAEVGGWPLPPEPRDPATRYRIGYATGDFNGVAVRDSWEGTIFPLDDPTIARSVVEALNDGMPNPLTAGVGSLRFAEVQL